MTSDVPEVMAILTTSLTLSTSVEISWTQPFNNYATLDQYEIMFLKSDGSFA